jgi:hypothetical protein
MGVMESLKFRPAIVERTKNLIECIGLARAAMAKCQFDAVGCSQGLKRLRAYRKEWDEQRGVLKDRPRHDEASHGASAFMTFSSSNVEAIVEKHTEEQRYGRDRDKFRRPAARGSQWAS